MCIIVFFFFANAINEKCNLKLYIISFIYYYRNSWTLKTITSEIIGMQPTSTCLYLLRYFILFSIYFLFFRFCFCFCFCSHLFATLSRKSLFAFDWKFRTVYIWILIIDPIYLFVRYFFLFCFQLLGASIFCVCIIISLL